MGLESSGWVTHDEAAAEAVERLAVGRGRSRQPDPAGGTLVALPEATREGSDEGVSDNGRSLVTYLEAHVERLTEELAEARTEMRGVRYEAECLRVEAGRAQVFAALVDAERARSAEIRAERDRLAEEIAEGRRPWIARLLCMISKRRPTRLHPS